MSRNLSTNTVGALDALVVLPVIFLDIAFASGSIRLHTGYGPLTLLGNSYQGTGGLLSVSSVEEGDDMASHGTTFSLSGIDPAYIATFLSEHYRGRKVRAWLAFFQEGSSTLLADPYEFFTGWLDTATMTEDGTTATISVQAESELVDLKRSRAQLYTDANMKRYNPTDRGFEFVQGIKDRSILWGKTYREGEAGYWKRKGNWLGSRFARLTLGPGIGYWGGNGLKLKDFVNPGHGGGLNPFKK